MTNWVWGTSKHKESEMTLKLLAWVNGGTTHNERKFKSEMSVDKKHDEFNFVHIEFKFISEIISGDFYQRVKTQGKGLDCS